MRPGVNKTIPDLMRTIVEEVKFDLWWKKFPHVGKVTKVYESNYSVDVQLYDHAFLPEIPMCSLFAQDGYGVFILPEVGSEVLVIFEDGDICEPVAVLPLWRKNKPMAGFRAGQIAIVDKQGQEISLKPDTGKITVKANTQVLVEAPMVNLGGEAGERLLLESAAALLAGHVHPHPEGTTGQSVELQGLAGCLSNVVKAIK